MSSTRNKRKRPENDNGVPPTTSSRRSRTRANRAAESSDTITPENELQDAPTGSEEASGDDPKPQHSTKAQHNPEQPNDEAGKEGAEENTAPNSSAAAQEKSTSTMKSSSPSPEDANTIDKASSKASNQSQSTPAMRTTPSSKKLDVTKSHKENASDDGGRASKISALAVHRKILLQRMQLCRQAAHMRLKDSVNGVTESKIEGQESDSAKKATAEAKEWQELTKAVTLAAKKSKTDDVATEKRTSLSLRRGASVGKRMNAALSSLAPGAASNSHSHNTAAAVAVASGSQHLHPPATRPVPPAQSNNSSTAPKSASIALQPSKAPSANSILPQQIPSSKTLKNSNSSNAIATKSVNTKSERQYNPKVTKIPPNARPSMASKQHEYEVRPQHASLPSSMLPHNRLAESRVEFPEAIALREKRNHLLHKLATLMEKQENREDTNSLQQRSNQKQGINPRIATVSARALALLNTPTEPTPLPTRRKTHWDHMLQEMRWMATDFIEERKWKHSAASSLGRSVVENSVVQTIKSRVVETAKSSPDPVATTVEDISIDSGQAEPTKTPANNKQIRMGVSSRYLQPTPEDLTEARKVSDQISVMFSELIGAMQDGGVVPRSDEAHKDAYKRYLEILGRSDAVVVKDEEDDNRSKESDDMDIDNSSVECGNAEDIEDEKDATTGEVTFETISDYIEKLIDGPVESRPRSLKNEKPKVVDSDGLTLYAGQKDAIQFLEELWDRTNFPGGVLAGPASSGKTIAACTLLWKQRSYGPQMLVCPPSSMIRWKHELRRFKDVNIVLFGLNGGISNPNDQMERLDGLGPGDIVVCELASLPRARSVLGSAINRFYSIGIDCRHPLAFRKSLHLSISGRIQHQAPSDSHNLKKIPCELMSTTWWDEVVEFALQGKTRRLLIEYTGSDDAVFDEVDMSEKERIVIVALRAAFILGPSIFQSPTVPLSRRILSWARKKGKKSTTDKIKRVRHVLEDVSSPFCLEIEGIINADQASSRPRGGVRWETRSCHLPDVQRSDYDSTCRAVRGALSGYLDLSRSDVEFLDSQTSSTALMSLRRLCIHSRMSTLFHDKIISSRITVFQHSLTDGSTSHPSAAEKFCGAFFDSSSQPDTEIALLILERSAKFRELLSIIKYDCGYSLQNEEALERFLYPENRWRPNKSKSKRKPGRPKKVAIIGVLPEAQLAASILLNAVGVAHKFLPRTLFAFDCSKPMDAKTDAVVWSEQQVALSQFNSATAVDSSPATNIVITSPQSIAGEAGGLGVEMADIVVCLDDDWSGRGEINMKYIAARCLARNKSTSTDKVRLLRLVCANTLEEVLLGTGSRKNALSDDPMLDWPIDDDGQLRLPEAKAETFNLLRKTSKTTGSSIFEFPATNLLQFRGESLSTVLVTKIQLSRLFSDDGDAKFFPSINSRFSSSRKIESEMTKEVAFLKALMHNERSAGSSWDVRPFRAYFPPEIVSRMDTSVLQLRMYLFHQCAQEDTFQEGTAHGNSGQKGLPQSSASSADSISKGGTAQETDKNNRPDSSSDAYGMSNADVPSTSNASSIFYDASDSHAGNVLSPSVAASLTTKEPRINKFVSSFSQVENDTLNTDGNQGSEAVIYFPPLFPGLLDCFSAAKAEAESFEAAAKTRHVAPYSCEPPKRKEPEASCTDSAGSPLPSAKRVRIGEEAESDKPNGQTPIQDQNAKPEEALTSIMPLNGSHNANPEQIIPPEIADEFLSEMLNDMDSPVISEGAISPFDLFDEDFGLLGLGAIAPESRSAMIGASLTTQSNCVRQSYYYDENEVSFFAPSSFDEISSLRDEQRLDQVLLFTKRRKNGHFQTLGTPIPMFKHPVNGMVLDNTWAGMQLPPAHFPTSNVLSGSHFDLHGAAGGKKMKKKNQNQPPGQPTNLAYPALLGDNGGASGMLQSGFPSAKISESHQRKLLASFTSRQYGTGLSMFESISYKVESGRVLKRVAGRVANYCWKSGQPYEAGPGAPLYITNAPRINDGSRRWSTVGKLSPLLSPTDDHSSKLASSQLALFRQSRTVPCRVDFGPFRSGFLSLPSGMTKVGMATKWIGISLPLGVKVQQDIPSNIDGDWTTEEDDDLARCVRKFGENWILVSKLYLNDTHQVPPSVQVGAQRSKYRSALQCRDRWQHLNEQNNLKGIPRLSSIGVGGTPIPRMSSLPVITDGRSSSTLLLPSDFTDQTGVAALVAVNDDQMGVTVDEKKEESHSKDVEMASTKTASALASRQSLPSISAKPRHSFAAIKKAKVKKHVVPMTIPGVMAGNPPSFVPIHESHVEPVQSAIASQWPNGRSEMWPLHIIEMTDKQRSAAAATTSSRSAATLNGSSSSNSKSSHPARRQHPISSSSQAHHSSTSRGHSTAGSKKNTSFPPIPSNGTRPPQHGVSESVAPPRADAVAPTLTTQPSVRTASSQNEPKSASPPQQQRSG